MSLSLGEAVLDLTADGSGLEKDINATKPGVLSALDGLGKAGGMLLAAGLMVAVTVLVGITTMIWDAGQTLDAAYDSIAVKTGATGDKLKGLQEDFDKVFSSVPTDADTAAEAIGILNSRLGITGPTLQDTTKNLLEFSRLTKTDASANAEQFADIVGSWNIPVDKASESLDVLFVAAQKTGVPVGDLMTAVQDSGPVLRQYGFSFEESAAFLAQMGKAGLDTGAVMQGLKSAAGKYAATGKPLNEGLAETLQLIKDAKDPTEALNLATETFGGRAGPAMVDAIRSGKMGFEQLLPLLKDADGAIMDTAASTMDWGERWQMFRNKMTVALGPAGMGLMAAVNAMLTVLEDTLARPDVQLAIMSLVNGIVWLAQTAAANLPAVVAGFFQFIDFLKNNQGIVVAILAVIGASLIAFGVSAATAAITAMAPLLPIVAVIALIGAAAYLLYQAWTTNFGGIQEKVAAFWAWIEPLFKELRSWFNKVLPVALAALAKGIQSYAIWAFNNLKIVMGVLVAFWQTILQPALQVVATWFAKNLPAALATLVNFWKSVLQPALLALWRFLSTNMTAALRLLANFWTGTLLPAIARVWSWLKGTLFPFLMALGNFISVVLGKALTALAGIWEKVVWPAIQKVFEQLSRDLMPVFQALSDWWNSTGQPVAESIAHWIGDVVAQAFDGLNQMIQNATGWLQELAGQLANMTLPDWMTPGSPTPWEIGLVGVNRALNLVANGGLPNVNSEMGAMNAPAIASGNMQLASGGAAGGAVVIPFNYSPFITTNNEYDAKRALRPFIEQVVRELQRK